MIAADVYERPPSIRANPVKTGGAKPRVLALLRDADV
jgi:hypothetical protein